VRAFDFIGENFFFLLSDPTSILPEREDVTPARGQLERGLIGSILSWKKLFDELSDPS